MSSERQAASTGRRVSVSTTAKRASVNVEGDTARRVPEPHPSLPPARRRLISSVLAIAATLAFATSGCGGEASAEEKWADSVCTDVNDWRSELNQATDAIKAELQSPEAGTLAAIDAAVRKAGGATRQLANDLKAHDAPNGESGVQAKQELDALASQLEATMTRVRQTLDRVPEGAEVSEIVNALASLAPELRSLAVNTSSTLQAVQANGSDLKEGFEHANSCKEFR
jgi:uncharacterized phage infection (PIP) family protein YhgE